MTKIRPEISIEVDGETIDVQESSGGTLPEGIKLRGKLLNFG